MPLQQIAMLREARHLTNQSVRSDERDEDVANSNPLASLGLPAERELCVL